MKKNKKKKIKNWLDWTDRIGGWSTLVVIFSFLIASICTLILGLTQNWN